MDCTGSFTRWWSSSAGCMSVLHSIKDKILSLPRCWEPVMPTSTPSAPELPCQVCKWCAATPLKCRVLQNGALSHCSHHLQLGARAEAGWEGWGLSRPSPVPSSRAGAVQQGSPLRAGVARALVVHLHTLVMPSGGHHGFHMHVWWRPMPMTKCEFIALRSRNTNRLIPRSGRCAKQNAMTRYRCSFQKKW